MTERDSRMTSYRSSGNDIPNFRGLGSHRPQHSVAYKVSHRLRNGLIMAIIAVLCFAGTAAASAWADLVGTLDSRTVSVIPQAKGDDKEDAIVDPNAGKSIELLLIGQDTREGEGNSGIGGTEADMADLHNSDTAIVMQISADRKWINMVSIPRDSMVDVPSCETSKGTIPAQSYVMFNSIFPNAYSIGGDLASAASCTMSAVNSLTGLHIKNFVVVDFNGLKSMIDAIGGVDVCIPMDMTDPYTGLNLPKGMNHLDGTQATQYARTRHATGTDGSDIMRTTRQQYLIKQLFNKVKSANLLTQTDDLYQLAKSALKSLNISSGLANISTLVGLATSLSSFDISHMYAQTVPIIPDPQNINRRVWAETAEEVWGKLRHGKPLVSNDSSKAGDADSSDASDTQGNANGEASLDGTTAEGTGTEETGGNGQATTQTPAPDPTTGVITMADGTLIDAATGGIIDPETGAIRDPNTGEYSGMADRYLNNTVCAVPAQE